MHVERDDRLDGGMSRRQLLARGAIAGGLVWAAPVIRTTAAYATTANGTERPCIDFYMVVINPAGQVRPAPADHDNASIPPAIRQWFRDNPRVPVQFPKVTPQLTQTGGDAWAVLLPAVTGPNAAARQCRMVLGWGRKGNSFAEGYVDPNPPFAIDVGRRLLFPCAGKDLGNGHSSGAVASNAAPTETTTPPATTPPETTPPDATPVPDPNATTDPATGIDESAAALGAAGAPTTTEPPALDAAGTISSDGGSPVAVGTDGGPITPLTGDGRPSGNTDGPGPGPGTCIDAIYLVYCCPR
jgi:hypothetical protein